MQRGFRCGGGSEQIECVTNPNFMKTPDDTYFMLSAAHDGRIGAIENWFCSTATPEEFHDSVVEQFALPQIDTIAEGWSWRSSLTTP